jgi:hypothetical protein
MGFPNARRDQNLSNTRDNGVRVVVTHSWIRLDLGNNRGLTTSFGGTKSTGSVPEAVFRAWVKATDEGEGKLIDRVNAFADELPTLWPEWNDKADLSEVSVGTRIRMFFGKRKGYREGTIEALPKRKNGRFRCRFDGDQFITTITADMVAASLI